MPRHKEFEQTDVVAKAMQLFWRDGYEGTSMRTLLAEMGISRQSLYDTFGGKHGLFLAALDAYGKGLSNMPIMAPTASFAAIREQFEVFLGMIDNQESEKSCFMANTALELGQKNPQVQQQVQGSLRLLEAAFLSALQRAEKTGAIPQGKNLKELACFLTSSTHGLGVLASSGYSAQELRAAVKVILSVLSEQGD